MEVIWSGWDVLHPRLNSPCRLDQACAKGEQVFVCVSNAVQQDWASCEVGLRNPDSWPGWLVTNDFDGFTGEKKMNHCLQTFGTT